MDTYLSFANWLLPLIYLAMVIDYGATFILRVRTRRRNFWIIPVIAFHALFLVLRGIRLGVLPLADNYEILSVVALSAAAVYWLTEFAGRDRRTGVFVFLLIFLCQYTSSTFLAAAAGGASGAAGPADYGWGRLHVLPATFAYTAMAFAAVYALLFLVGRRNLKQHRLGLLFDRLPSLERLGRMSWYALLFGLAFMTVTVITGVVLLRYAEQRQVMELKVTAKIVTGSLAWLICAVAVFGRIVGKWSVLRVSRIAVAGFLAVIALLVSSILLS